MKLSRRILSVALLAAIAAPAAHAEVPIDVIAGSEITFEGLLQADANWFNSDVANLNGDAQDGRDFDGELRRAELVLKGKGPGNLEWVIGYDAKADKWLDTNLKYKLGGNANHYLQFGQFKQPNSLEELSSTKNNDFISKATITNTWAVARRVGAAYSVGDANWSITGAYFDDELKRGLAAGAGYGVRGTWAPINATGSILHLGLSYVNYDAELPAVGANNLVDTQRWRARPQADLSGTRLIDTGNLALADKVATTGVEAFWVHGPLKLQGEYMRSTTSRGGAFSDFTGTGAYVSAVWNVRPPTSPAPAPRSSIRSCRSGRPTTSRRRQATGKQVNYQSIGSGGGIAQIKAGTVDFGSSDAPLKPEELAKFGLAQFPSVIGGVVPVLNVPGVPPGAMKLDGDLADIFLGKITKWNDPRIAALNGGLQAARPEDHRGAPLGRLGHHLQLRQLPVQGQPGVEVQVGEGTSVKWPVGIGGKGNEGVAAYVKQIKGGIGYVELSYALQNKLAYSRLKNAAGNFVEPERRQLLRRRRQRRLGQAKDFYLVMTNAPGEDSLADHRHQLHPDVQEAEERGRREERQGLLPLGLRQRRRPGQVARLRAAAGRAGAADRGLLGQNMKY
jgi:phosphate-selective porin OprO/OprP